jgi:hypothetical protein
MHLKLSTWIILLSLLSSLHAQFNKLETDNLRLIYFGKTQSYLINHVARCSENAIKFHRDLFDYTPSEKITILLHDFSDFGNAGAGVVPKNHVSLGIAPVNYTFEISPANERMNSTMNHEIVHIVASDKATKTDNLFRIMFGGKVNPNYDQPLSMLYGYLTTPRRFAPRWYHEGIAVFMETWMSGGYGRALGGYDEMVFRTLVHDSTQIYNFLGLQSAGTKIDFQVGANAYLYGTRFMSYLAYQFGPEKLISWISRTEESSVYYIEQFKKIYNNSLDDAWSEWIQWEHLFQKANLDTIGLSELTSYRPLSNRPLGSVSRPFFDVKNKKLYAAINYPGQIAHIAAIDVQNGEIEKICNVKGPALYYVSSIAYDDSSKTIFYTTDNYDWRDLRSVNILSGESQILIEEARIGDLIFNPQDKSVWGVRHDNGFSTIVRIPRPYNEWNQIYTYPYGSDLYDIDISRDGKYLVGSLAEISGRQKLIRLSIEKLLQGDAAYEELCDFDPSIPNNFVFSEDGKYLFGSSYHTNVSNIYRYEFETNETSIVSNCETGFFRPLPISPDSLIVFRYTSEGFLPVMISAKLAKKVKSIDLLGHKIVLNHPVVTQWKIKPPTAIDLDSLITESGSYSGLKNIQIASVYPIVEGYKDYAAVGLRLNLMGPIGLHNMLLTGSYSPTDNLPMDERWHGDLKYTYMNWRVRLTYNAANFYDLFGPTKVSRRGYSLGIQYKKNLVFDSSRRMDYTINLTGYAGLDRLPDFQNIIAPFDQLLSGSINFNYQYLRASLGAVDYEKGYKFQVVTSFNYIHTTIFPRIYNTIDLGFPLPMNHSSIWLRTSFGYSVGRRINPYSNFYFGGFGNNWVDYLHEKRYRQYYSFPGVNLNSIAGTNYGKVLIEWCLPPIRFRRLGFSSFYSSWSRIALFSTGIVTNIDNRYFRRSVQNFGGQIDFRIIFLSHLKATISFGYAMALEKYRHPSREIMISLKIM